MTTVVIRADSYQAELALELLPELPLSNIRKLFHIMFRAAWENESPIQKINDWLSGAIPNAKADWVNASLDYNSNWRIVPKGYNSAGATQRRKKNRDLTRAVKMAKADYDKLAKIQSIFNETKEKYYA